MGFFAGLEEESYDRKYSDRELVARMGRFFRPLKREIIITLIALAVTSGSMALVPIVVAEGVDLIAEDFSVEAVLTLAGVLFFIGFLMWASNWVRRRKTSEIAGDVMLDMRETSFAAVSTQAL
ncbi:MAG: hypothetical protein R3191_04085, partial [Anaerolineales bacterium]|nr:hypothetical protein [Anaerolineales bacterium]